ncbi:MAG: 4'-phosphopantetheinyl transferase superfamily protein [Acutalibacteraceae bacterium]|nr:4'-phosphopantetheinyl transferase superfamily protein [Acutalibacteraceae bacterium]
MIQLYLLETEKLNNDEIFTKYYNRLSPYRKEKTDKMRMRKDKNLSLAVGIIIDTYLKRINMNEKDMHYSSEEYGKPYFENLKNLHFNASHSGEMALCAFSDSEVGCDIEIISKSNTDLAKRFFTQSEYEFIISTDKECTDISSQQEERFYRIWTLKESFLKLTGEGLSGGLNTFEIKFQDNNTPVVIKNSILLPIYFKEYSLKNYRIALCSKENIFPEEITIINI